MKNLFLDESGQGMVEYGLILALVSVVAIGALTLLGTNINAKLGDVNEAIVPTLP